MSFAHLNLHTEFSLSDSLVRVKPLFKYLKEQGANAVALTDLGNAFALIKFYKAALNAGIKPILGADCYLKINGVKKSNKNNNPHKDANKTDLISRVTLLAQNQTGYKNLCTLLSKGYREGQDRGIPQLSLEWLCEYNAGLIIIFSQESHLGDALTHNNEDQFDYHLEQLNIFKDRLYIGISRIGRNNEETYIQNAVRLCYPRKLPIVALNDVRFIHKDDFEAHEVRVCISTGFVLSDHKRPKVFTAEQYLKSPQAMSALFADLPAAIENSTQIAMRCNVTLSLDKPCLPDFPVPEGLSMAQYFKKCAADGLQWRFAELEKSSANADYKAVNKDEYIARLNIELDVIINMGFPGYFFIVADFIQWAKDNDIPVGPGRGSGAGSLVAWALKITDLDPIPYDLLFERFLNPERVSMPDFDIDFCMEGRDRVIEYVAKHYGREAVSQIATHGTMAAKAVVRDVGRALGYPYGMVDRIAKMIPFELGMTLSKALIDSPDLKQAYKQDEEITTLIDFGLQLEGLTKSVGRHAGGVVISPTLLTDFSPLYCEEGSNALVTQFDKDDVEAAGLVKFDFLGLRTLTIIHWALQHIEKTHAKKIDILSIPLNDKPSFDLLKRCETTAVFQLESRGMKDLISKLQPDTFEDIIALVALFRPGPLESGMVDDFINRKHGRADVAYPFPELEDILKPTYGVIVYQEQVMQISQVIGNYTLGGADLLRRAMGKKKAEEMADQRMLFMQGAEKLNFDTQKAGDLFDLMEKFAGYGFNKSHSAAYALISYQTAYLKSNYPTEFMAAVLSSDMDKTEKVVIFVEECREMKLSLLSPSINHSLYAFSVNNIDQIVYGLGALKGVGEAAITNTLLEREANGDFKDLFDLCARVDLSKMNKKVLETLIRAGALDIFCEALNDINIVNNQELNLQTRCQHRANLMLTMPEAIKVAEQFGKDKSKGQFDLFGMSLASEAPTPKSLHNALSWTEQDLLDAEKETLGYYFTAHPLDRFKSELKQIVTHTFADINELAPPAYRVKRTQEPPVLVAGLVMGVRTKISQKGNKMILVDLDDKRARQEIMLNDEHLKYLETPLAVDQVLIIKGSLGWNDFSNSMRINVNEIMSIDQMRAFSAKWLLIEIESDKFNQELSNKLISLLGNYSSASGVKLRLRYHKHKPDLQSSIEAAFPETLCFKACQELLDQLKLLLNGQARFSFRGAGFND
ncbi:DNA polymerase III alpha subunit DnaE [Gammaproteobacteria bacterium]|nr:DNA polymerase III alpha subunit DnaE [Gammaproteobacteria bacterium]